MSRAALVTTTKAAGDSLADFVTYHLHVGFERIYLFFDDPADPMRHLAALPQVTAWHDEVEIDRLWQQTPLRHDYGRHFRPKVYIQDRQMRNVAVAMRQAARDGIDWLLHLDDDELLFAPEFFDGMTVTDMFGPLGNIGLATVMYLNDEAIVDRATLQHPFREVVQFKRNVHQVDAGHFSAEQRQAIAAIPSLPPQLFKHYASGKSAVRVGTPGVFPSTSHAFSLPEQRSRFARLRRRAAENRFTRQHAPSARLKPVTRRLLAPQTRRTTISGNPIILHYGTCTFDSFWQKYTSKNYLAQLKGRELGDRTDLHEAAQRLADAQDVAAARQFFEAEFVLTPASLAQLAAVGLVHTIEQPAALLRQIRPK